MALDRSVNGDPLSSPIARPYSMAHDGEEEGSAQGCRPARIGEGRGRQGPLRPCRESQSTHWSRGLFVAANTSARVRLDGSRLVIDDFISPSILERLGHQDGVLSPQVTDWRSMVDSVMIDTAYDGSVFNVAVADIPERKTDVVAGSYDLELPAGASAPVAVKVTDMLGEEVLVVLDR